MKISVCGKGGSGKSTLVTLLAKQAQDKKLRVVVVDSDESNSGLYRMLGFEKPPTPLMELVGGKKKLKEKMRQDNVLREKQISIGDIPAQYAQAKDDLTLISIGKILQSLEGCACPMGVLNREFLKKLHLGEDEIAIIDMEAGVEHFGRGIDDSIDHVLLVVDPSFESLTVAKKVKSLAEGISKRVSVVLNKIESEDVAFWLKGELNKLNMDVIGMIPNDPVIFNACLKGLTLDQGEAYSAAGWVLDSILLNR